MGVLLPVLRVSLTGLAMGPSLFNIAELIGKKLSEKLLCNKVIEDYKVTSLKKV